MGLLKNNAPLWHPINWPVRLALAALRAAVVVLPYPALAALGRAMGHVALRLSRERRHVAEVNLRLCFPELSDRERAALLREHFEAMGIAVFELGLSWWGDRRKLERMFHLEGIEHIEGAKAAGRGVLLVCCHMGPHELCATLFAPHSPVPCLGIYKPFKNPVVDRVSVVSRSRFAELAQRSSLRKAIRHLRDGGAVWYAPDQSEGRPGGILVPFFGEPKVVNTGPARLAAASNALVMPFHTWRDADGYHVAILPALERFPSGDATADARSIMEACEVHILRAPAQYSWTHRRFRKRLGQLPSPY